MSPVFVLSSPVVVAAAVARSVSALSSAVAASVAASVCAFACAAESAGLALAIAAGLAAAASDEDEVVFDASCAESALSLLSAEAEAVDEEEEEACVSFVSSLLLASSAFALSSALGASCTLDWPDEADCRLRRRWRRSTRGERVGVGLLGEVLQHQVERGARARRAPGGARAGRRLSAGQRAERGNGGHGTDTMNSQKERPDDYRLPPLRAHTQHARGQNLVAADFLFLRAPFRLGRFDALIREQQHSALLADRRVERIDECLEVAQVLRGRALLRGRRETRVIFVAVVHERVELRFDFVAFSCCNLPSFLVAASNSSCASSMSVLIGRFLDIRNDLYADVLVKNMARI